MIDKMPGKEFLIFLKKIFRMPTKITQGGE